VGAAVDGAVRWLFSGLSQLLAHIFGSGSGHPESSTELPPRANAGPTSCAPGDCPKRALSLLDQIFLLLPAVYALVLFALLFFGVAFVGNALLGRLLAGRAARAGDEPADEEREALAGGSLILHQLRDLFTRRRRRPTVAEELLVAGSVRV